MKIITIRFYQRSGKTVIEIKDWNLMSNMLILTLANESIIAYNTKDILSFSIIVHE